MRGSIIVLSALAALAQIQAQPTGLPGNLPNDVAVKEVLSGTRSVASAAWWGFDPQDATAPLQKALNSGAKTLIIPYMAAPWVIRPVLLPSNQEILLEPGVVVLAKKGEFQGGGDSLFTAVGQSNLVLRGYGACLRMYKRDYQKPPYQPAEWRMGVAVRGCRHVRVEGLRVESTGGDGFYIDGGAGLDWSEDITLQDCTAYDNHRQGVSVISAVGLRIEHCRFANTWGTAPEAGIDLEPDTENQRLVNCVVRNSLFENNNGHQILVYLKPLTTNSEPVSIRFENCLCRMTDPRLPPDQPGPTNGLKGVSGIAVGEIKDNGPQGRIDFVNCVAENTSEEGARIYDKSARSARVRFLNCSFSNPWNPAPKGRTRPSILLQLRHPNRTSIMGGIDFLNCYVFDTVRRPALEFDDDRTATSLRDVHGKLFVRNPGQAGLSLGTHPQEVDVSVVPMP